MFHSLLPLALQIVTFYIYFLLFPADNLTVNEQLTGPHTAGINSILPKEHGSQFFYLPIIRHSDQEVGAMMLLPSGGLNSERGCL